MGISYRPDYLNEGQSPHRGFALVTVLILVSLLAVAAVTVNRVGGMQAILSSDQGSSEEAYYAAVAGIEHAIFVLKSVDSAFRSTMNNVPFGKGSYTVSVMNSPSPAGDIMIVAKGSAGNNVNVAVMKRHGDKDSGSILFPPLIKDTFIDVQDPVKNFGGSDYMLVGAKKSGKVARGLLEFDLSSIPPGATIASAILELYMYNTSTPAQGVQIEVNVHRVTRSWKEGNKNGSGNSNGASWEEYDGMGLWATLGADFDAAVEAAATILTQEEDQWHSWEIASLVQYWVDNPSDHFGMILKDLDEGTDQNNSFYGTFYSREDTYGNGAFKPRLTVILQ